MTSEELDLADWFERSVANRPVPGDVSVGDARMAYTAWGIRSADAVCMLHGFAAHARWWDWIAPHLAGGHRVVAPDLFGMGDSDWLHEYSLETQAHAVAELIQVLDLAPATLVGHSFGGFVAVAVAALYPALVRRVILVDAGVRPRGVPPRAGNVFRSRSATEAYASREEAISRFRLVPAQPCEHDFILAYVAENSLREVKPGWAWKFDPKLVDTRPSRKLNDYFEGFAAPLDVVYGSDSSVVTPAHLDYFNAARPDAAPFHCIERAGHHLLLDQPLALTRTLKSLLHD